MAVDFNIRADREKSMQTQPRDLPLIAMGLGKTLYLLRTGVNDVTAAFTPALYHLRLHQRDGTYTQHELGFAGTRLLECLISSRGNALSRDELTSYAWPDRVVGQGSLNQQIYTLRQLLSDDKTRAIIQTLPRRGYLFDPAALINVELAERSEPWASANELAVSREPAVAAGLASTADASPPESRSPESRSTEPKSLETPSELSVEFPAELTAELPAELPAIQRQLLARAAPIAEALAVDAEANRAKAAQAGELTQDTAQATSTCPFGATKTSHASPDTNPAPAIMQAGSRRPNWHWGSVILGLCLGITLTACGWWSLERSAQQALTRVHIEDLEGALGQQVRVINSGYFDVHPYAHDVQAFADAFEGEGLEIVLLDGFAALHCPGGLTQVVPFPQLRDHDARDCAAP